MIAQLSAGGNIDMAFKLLLPSEGIRYNLHDSYHEHAETLDKVKGKLAALSDGVIKWEHGRGRSAIVRVPSAIYPHVWLSAHEAAAGSVKDLCERYAVNAHTVLGWIKRGELVAINVARRPGAKKPRWRITAEALDAFERLRSATPPPPRAPRRKRDTETIQFFR